MCCYVFNPDAVTHLELTRTQGTIEEWLPTAIVEIQRMKSVSHPWTSWLFRCVCVCVCVCVCACVCIPTEGAVREKTSAPSSPWGSWGCYDLWRRSNVFPNSRYVQETMSNLKKESDQNNPGTTNLNGFLPDSCESVMLWTNQPTNKQTVVKSLGGGNDLYISDSFKLLVLLPHKWSVLLIFPSFPFNSIDAKTSDQNPEIIVILCVPLRQ